MYIYVDLETLVNKRQSIFLWGLSLKTRDSWSHSDSPQVVQLGPHWRGLPWERIMPGTILPVARFGWLLGCLFGGWTRQWAIEVLTYYKSLEGDEVCCEDRARSVSSGREKLNIIMEPLISEKEVWTTLPYFLNIQNCVSFLLLICWLGVTTASIVVGRKGTCLLCICYFLLWAIVDSTMSVNCIL